MKPKIKIDIVSDVVCPWCYIGKRRLEKAIDQLSSQYDFELEYHPFELNPDMPASGTGQKEYLVKKFGSEDRYEELTARVTQVAAGEGLTFDYENQAIAPNTRKAHSLIQLAKIEGKHLQLMEALFKAYFTEGIDLSRDKNLMAIAVSNGLDQGKVERLLSSQDALLQVALAEQEAYKLGISGVPFYIINSKYGVSGAQSSESFIQTFQEIGNTAVASGDACDVDGKDC